MKARLRQRPLLLYCTSTWLAKSAARTEAASTRRDRPALAVDRADALRDAAVELAALFEPVPVEEGVGGSTRKKTQPRTRAQSSHQVSAHTQALGSARVC